MAIFHHSFTDIENYPIVSPLNLIISFKYPDQGSPPTLGDKGKRYSLKDYKRLNALKNKMSKNKTKTLKKELRELENQRKNDEKRQMNKKTMKNDLSRNDPWLRLP